MKRKRLQHMADTLCHKFCGTDIFFDYNTLLSLGNGEIKIDVRSGKCFFNHEPIRQLSVVKSLTSWMNTDCITNHIDLNLIFQAELTIMLEFSIISWSKRKFSRTEEFFYQGKPYKTKKMNKCKFICESIIRTDEKVYSSTFKKIREWPQRWPDAGDWLNNTQSNLAADKR
ncbi:MAG: hypothetical protein ACE14V_10675 [bacterium]